MRKLFIVFALCVCSFSFIACNDKEDKEETVTKPAESVYYYLVGDYRIDYIDLCIFEYDAKGNIIEKKTQKVISGDNPVLFEGNKFCDGITIAYKSLDYDFEGNSIVGYRMYSLRGDEFLNEKEYIMLTLGTSVSEEEYLNYCNLSL